MKRILAVDSDIATYEKAAAQWAVYDISIQRVETMHEAIYRLGQSQNYLYIGINEDSVPDFASQLPLMRDITDIPVFVTSSTCTIDKKIKVISLGADAYDHYSVHAKHNVLLALETLKAQKRWAKRSPESEILICGDIILSQSRRTVFVKDVKLFLVKKEFDVLQCLMLNNGRVVSHLQLLHEAWDKRCEAHDAGLLWRTVNRLRKKLAEISPESEYIKLERGVGYILLP